MAGQSDPDQAVGDRCIYSDLVFAYHRFCSGNDQPGRNHTAVFKKWRQHSQYPCRKRYKTLSYKRNLQDKFFQCDRDEYMPGSADVSAAERGSRYYAVNVPGFGHDFDKYLVQSLSGISGSKEF